MAGTQSRVLRLCPALLGLHRGLDLWQSRRQSPLQWICSDRPVLGPDGGINISTAVAISGAAASPSCGYHTNPATAFLMTLFNVRLGWWISNPRKSKLAGCLADAPACEPEWPSPRFAPKELFKELLGRTDDGSDFVYLSDGGHFDNMGLYELVRRRCYRIVICDGEQDEKYVFEGIGMAIRKCRIDFGVEVTLDPFGNVRPDLTTGDCKAHFAIGKIRYPETPRGEENEGIILYMKSSLTGSNQVNNEAAESIHHAGCGAIRHSKL